MQIEDRYERFRDYALGMSVSEMNRWRLALLVVLCTGPYGSIAKWPWNRGYSKPVITAFLPGAIDHVRDEFGPLHLPFMVRKFCA